MKHGFELREPLPPLDEEYDGLTPLPGDRPPLLWPGLRGALGTVFAAVAVIFLQAVLSAFFWIADPELSVALAPAWDLPVIVLLLVLWAAIGPSGRWADRLVVLPVSLILVFYFIVGLGQGFAQREFGYDVVLRLHASYVPELFRMMYNEEPLGWFVFHVALLAVGTILVVLAIWGSVRHLHAYARRGRRRQLGLAAGVVAAFLVGASLFGPSGPITVEAYRQLDLAVNLDTHLSTGARRLELEAAPLWKMNPFIKGAEKPTILVFVVESYGHVLFSDPEFAEFPAWLEKQAAELRGAGYTIASKDLASTVFGGSSWLAGTSLLCGVRIHNQKRFQSLFASSVRCLPAMLNDAGYRTVVSAANTTRLDDSYARTLPFDRFYFRDDFGYRGPRMGWSYMPDQFTIDFVHRHEIAPRLAAGGAGREPLFVAYFLSTSHHPWSVIPPFVADWSKIGDGTVYNDLEVTEFHDNQFVAGNDYKKAYRTSIEYSLRSIASYLQQLPADDRSLVIILGDHQPRRPVAGMKKDPWWVPIHVLSRDPAAVARFAGVGYRPGIVPAAAPEASSLDRFVPELFTAYTGAGGR